MISIDPNILQHSYSEASPRHAAATLFLETLAHLENVALNEYILSEFYLHLRKPAVLDSPLGAEDAVAVVHGYRKHPKWCVLGFPPRSRALHAALGKAAATLTFAGRRLYDLRVALCLQAFGDTEFATGIVKDFVGTGFLKVWNPLAASQ